jgi:hypothetical protein
MGMPGVLVAALIGTTLLRAAGRCPGSRARRTYPRVGRHPGLLNPVRQLDGRWWREGR